MPNQSTAKRPKRKVDPPNLEYAAFLAKKSQLGGHHGFKPVWMPDFLHGFQSHLDTWAIEKGRAAIFADCGLGKTPMQLVFAQNVREHTNKPVLVLTPLAVASQTAREAAKFGIDATVSRDGKVMPNITIANYDRLHYFNPNDFSGVVCDEAPSCIKAMDGKLRAQVTEFLRQRPYRLLCTATPAPNDYVELGTGSEALGEMGQRDMIGMFFKEDNRSVGNGWGRAKFRLKGHAESAFWKWVCSWARACRKPSDLGFSDEGFDLPELIEQDHIVEAKTLPPGYLYPVPARDMQEERAERRRTIVERCEKVAELVNHDKPAVVWCHLNDEGDLLAKLIPDARQVSGTDSIDEKEAAYEAFSNGSLRVVVIKPKIGAWGLNWQHCSHVVMFGSHSYEQCYQAKRRCWRFGQKNKVKVDTVLSEGEQRVQANQDRKKADSMRMFASLIENMNQTQTVQRINGTQTPGAPSWLS